MQAADEFQQISSSLYTWQAYVPSAKADLNSCAVVLKSGLVFIDPIPLENNALAELLQLGVPQAIVLTNGNHERATGIYKEQFNIPVYANLGAKGDLTADVWVEEGELFESIRVVTLPGFGPGEIALHLYEGEGCMLMGDALINFGAYEFSLLPEKYCTDAKQGRESLQKLLSLDFEAMTFAHGTPIISGAKARLRKLLTH